MKKHLIIGGVAVIVVVFGYFVYQVESSLHQTTEWKTAATEAVNQNTENIQQIVTYLNSTSTNK